MMRRRSELRLIPPQPWSQLILPDSFYARLAAWRDVLVNERGLHFALQGFGRRPPEHTSFYDGARHAFLVPR
jgi:hypothetical protein